MYTYIVYLIYIYLGGGNRHSRTNTFGETQKKKKKTQLSKLLVDLKRLTIDNERNVQCASVTVIAHVYIQVYRSVLKRVSNRRVPVTFARISTLKRTSND